MILLQSIQLYKELPNESFLAYNTNLILKTFLASFLLSQLH